MTEKDTGGPAFPHTAYSKGTLTDAGAFIPLYEHTGGMTLRDWFAGQALAGLMSNCDSTGMNGWLDVEDHAARRAYEAADAMIAARDAK